MASATRKLIDEAIDRLRRYEQPVTLDTVRSNIDLDRLSLGDLHDSLRRTINAQIPARLKELGYVITDTLSRERKPYWESTPDELEEQIRVKEQSSDYDLTKLKADKAALAFLKEKSQDFGYAVYPELFREDITRIYAMHGVDAPGLKTLSEAA